MKIRSISLICALVILAGCDDKSVFMGMSSEGNQIVAEANSLVGPNAGQINVTSQSTPWRCASTRSWSFGATDETVPLACSDRRSGSIRMVMTGPSQGIMDLQLSDGESARLTGGNSMGMALAAATNNGQNIPRISQNTSGQHNCRAIDATCYINMGEPEYSECMARPVCGN